MMLALLSLLACDGGAPAVSTTPPPSRVEGVVAAPKKETPIDEVCEVHAPAATAKLFALPEIDGPPMARGAGWTWVNVWATWCEPCVEEMPMLQRWQARLAKEGVDVALQFLSVDAKADDVTAWRKVHPDAPPSMRFAQFSALGDWLASVGLDASAVIPIHFFLDPDQKIRCVRMGAVGEPEYPAIKKVLAGE